MQQKGSDKNRRQDYLTSQVPAFLCHGDMENEDVDMQGPENNEAVMFFIPFLFVLGFLVDIIGLSFLPFFYWVLLFNLKP